MLEFIVLGQIPGTSIQIGFKELIQFTFLLVAILLIGIELKIRKIDRPKLRDIINRLAL